MKLRLAKRILALALCTMLSMGGMPEAAADIVSAQGLTATEQDMTEAGGATVSGSDYSAEASTQDLTVSDGNTVSGSDLFYRDDDVSVHIHINERLPEGSVLVVEDIRGEHADSILDALLEYQYTHMRPLNGLKAINLYLKHGEEELKIGGGAEISFTLTGAGEGTLYKLFWWKDGLEPAARNQAASFLLHTAEGLPASYILAEFGPETEYISGLDVTKASPLGPPAVGAGVMLRAGVVRSLAPAAFRSGAASRNLPGLVINKTAEWDEEEEKYKITLEAYTEGTVQSETVPIPTDIVLVLDQSGSMAIEDFPQYTLASRIRRYRSYWKEVQLENGSQYVEVTYHYGAGWRYWNPDTNVWVSLGEDTSGFCNRTNVQRMVALKDAASRFVQSVYQKAKEENTDHRIAIVGFGSKAGGYWLYGDNGIPTGQYREVSNWNGSGLFIGGGLVSYGNTAQINNSYQNAFMHVVDSQSGSDAPNAVIMSSIAGLTAAGATATDLGMEMANRIFEKNPIPSGEQRNRVVVVFTDGSPTYYTGFDPNTANSAIGQAVTTKNTHNATVYTIGVQPGAQADAQTLTDRFMRYLSSQNKGNPDIWIPDNLQDPGNRGYYMTASNTNALNDAFQSISNNIVSPTIELKAETVLKDVISPSFSLATGEEGAVKAYTSDYMGGNAWGELAELSDAVIEKEGRSISVSNFDFSQNPVVLVDGSPRGKKLVVEIWVEPNPDFVGGNAVPTNTNMAGIYANGNAAEPLAIFTVPRVDVPIRYQFDTQDRSIYIGDKTGNEDVLRQLLDVGNQENIQFCKKVVNGIAAYYTLDGINNEFVDITYQIKKGDKILGAYLVEAGRTAGNWEWKEGFEDWRVSELTEDTDFAITVAVEPVNPGDVQGLTLAPTNGENTKLHVFSPRINLSDTRIFLGESTNLLERVEKAVVWKCSDESHGVEAEELLPGYPDQEPPVLEYTFETVDGTAVGGEASYTAFAPTRNTDIRIAVKRGYGDGSEALNITDAVRSKSGITNNGFIARPEDSILNDSELQNLPKEHDFTVYVLGGRLQISKKMDKTADKNLEGDAIFTFRIEYHETDSTVGSPTRTYYHTMRFSDPAVLEKTEEVLTGLPKGYYKVTELESLRYTLQGAASDSDFTNSAVSLIGAGKNAGVIFHIGLKSGNEYGTRGGAKFTNNKTGDSPKLTNTGVWRNSFYIDENGRVTGSRSDLLPAGN